MPAFPRPEDLCYQVTAIAEVATLPHVMARIVEVVEDSTSSARDLASEVATDTSLTAKVLKVVNSAYYGYPRTIARIADAVVILGFEEIRRISLAIGVVRAFSTGPAHGRHRLRLWVHSFQTAALAELLERRHGRAAQGAFTAGILHDLGRVVLDQHFPDIFNAVQEREVATQRTTAEVEADLLGCTHADVGSWVAERWNLPQLLVDAIQFHHRPGEAPDSDLPAAVHVADALVHDAALARGDETVPRELDATALDRLGLDAARLEGLKEDCARHLDEEATFISDLLEP